MPYIPPVATPLEPTPHTLSVDPSHGGRFACEGVIIRLRCSSFSDDIYIDRFHRASCKNTKKSCGAFISERIGVIFGMPVGDDNARNLPSIFFRTIP